MNKVFFVKAHFIAVGKNITVKVPTGETKKGFFGGEKNITQKEVRWEQTGYSDKHIDGERLANDLAEKVLEINSEGYAIKTITPVISGEYDFQFKDEGITSSPRIFTDGEAVKGGASYGYGYGYSYTDSLIIIAEKAIN